MCCGLVHDPQRGLGMREVGKLLVAEARHVLFEDVGDDDVMARVASAPLGQDEARVRVVSVDRDAGARRLAWLDQWLPDADWHDYAAEGSAALAQAAARFDLLVLEGDGAARLAGIVRDWRGIFPGKPILVVVTGATAHETAMLLGAGADALFAVDADPRVAAGQARAILRRVRDRAAVFLSAGAVRRYVRPGQALSPCERVIVERLGGSPGRVVLYDDLLIALGKSGRRGALRSLAVQICKLRPKLAEGVSIVAVSGMGYILG